MISKNTKKSPIAKNIFFAFVIGGLICVLGQLIFNFSIKYVDKETASTITSISLIFLSAFLTAINLYSRLGKIAGAGSTIPITGFANSIVSPAIEFKAEGYITGLGAKMFIIAGPVIVYGTAASVVYGVIYWVTTLF
jgi:stage V sporulation protein AC